MPTAPWWPCCGTCPGTLRRARLPPGSSCPVHRASPPCSRGPAPELVPGDPLPSLPLPQTSAGSRSHAMWRLPGATGPSQRRTVGQLSPPLVGCGKLSRGSPPAVARTAPQTTSPGDRRSGDGTGSNTIPGQKAPLAGADSQLETQPATPSLPWSVKKSPVSEGCARTRCWCVPGPCSASTGSSREMRLTNQVGAFHCLRGPGPGPASSRTLLIVDDILTTGATACNAARTLRQAGWRVAGLICLARTPARTPRVVAYTSSSRNRDGPG